MIAAQLRQPHQQQQVVQPLQHLQLPPQLLQQQLLQPPQLREGGFLTVSSFVLTLLGLMELESAVRIRDVTAIITAL